ncbi:MAG: hypothetical protein ACKOW3_01830 [Hyphomicrobium sp.]
MNLISSSTAHKCVIVVLLSGLVGACSADDVELNGGIFDALGVNKKTSNEEPKLAARTPLVVPPTTSSLPVPGEQPESQATYINALLNDPDRLAEMKKADLERQQAEFCSKNYDPTKAGMDATAEMSNGPLGPCRKSIMSAIQKLNGEDKPQ